MSVPVKVTGAILKRVMSAISKSNAEKAAMLAKEKAARLAKQKADALLKEKTAKFTARQYELKSSLVKKSLAKKSTPNAVETVAKKEASAGDVLRSAKAEGQATTARKLERATKFKVRTQAERGIISPVRPPRQIGPQLPKKTDVTNEGKGMPVRVSTRKPKPRKTGLKTTTGQRRVKVSDADAKDVSKELRNRPAGSRNREIPKPGSTTLTANEKALIKVKQPVEVKRVEPKSLQQIKDEKAAEKLTRTNRLLRRPSKRKVEGPKTEHQTKVIENAKKDVPRLPSHKVYVKVKIRAGIKKRKPDMSHVGPPGSTTRSAGKGEKGAYVRQPLKSAEDIRKEGDNANTNPLNWDVAGNRPKATIGQGRGNVPQPGSITRNRSVERHKIEVVERNRQRRANTGGPRIVVKQKNRNLIRRDANGKPILDSKGNLIVNLDRRTQRVYPKTASASTEARKQTAKVMRHRVKVAEKEVMAAEKKKAKSESVANKKSTRAAITASKRLKAKAQTKARLSKTRPKGK